MCVRFSSDSSDSLIHFLFSVFLVCLDALPETLTNTPCHSYFKTQQGEDCLAALCVWQGPLPRGAVNQPPAGASLQVMQHASKEGPRCQLWHCLIQETKLGQDPPLFPSVLPHRGGSSRVPWDSSTCATAPHSASSLQGHRRRASCLPATQTAVLGLHWKEPHGTSRPLKGQERGRSQPDLTDQK